jgi:hypothetical protein
MALSIGDPAATSGMTKAIYDQLLAALDPGLEGLEEQDKLPVRESWRKIAFAVATGVIDHLLTQLEVHGVRCAGNVSTAVSGSSGPAAPSNHVHAVNLVGVQNNATFLQSNDGAGRVR